MSAGKRVGVKEVEFFYDIVCPYAYLGATQVESIAARHEARVVWKPFLLGGVFRAIGSADNQMSVMSPGKLNHNRLDMHRWAEHFGVELNFPSSHPRRTVLALRALLAAGEESRVEATMALYRAYWSENRDIVDPLVVAEVLTDAGIDGERCVELASSDLIKLDLRQRTDEAIERGVFGAPAFFVGEQMFWGQDRLDFVERALAS